MISVIVPIYNVEKYLIKCIESIINQTYKNLEIILVDDGSPDNCPSICDEYAKKDDRIKVIHKENGGLSDARNVGIDASTGEYLAFVDSDDYISCDMLEKLYCRIVKDESDLAICNLNYVDESDRILDVGTIQVEDKLVDEIVFWNELYGVNYAYCVVAWNKLYRRKLFENVRYEKGRLHEDEYIIHQIVSQCNRISFLKDKCYNYLQRSDSIMGKSFSVKRLDFSEASIKRSLYFKKRRWQQLAELSLMRSIVDMQRGYQKLNMKDKLIKKRFKEIHKQYRQAYLKVAKGKPSLRFLINGMTFYLGIRFYNIIHSLKNNERR